jgi:Tfp pilus assembly protein PilO
MSFREHRALFSILAIILLANVVFFVTYRVRYGERLESLETRLESVRGDLERARRQRVEAERQLAGFEQIRSNISTVHTEHFSSSEQRLSRLITEIRAMTRQAGLEVSSISYDFSQQKRELDTASMRIDFSVAGSYSQIRRLINLFELSQQFVIIDEISLSGAAPGVLTLNISLKTIFHQPETRPAGSAG